MRDVVASVFLVLLAVVPHAARADRVVLDDFPDLAGWSAIASEGTHVWIARESDDAGTGMRIGFDLNTAGGYVIVRKTFSLALPDNYAFSFRLRGDARPNNFEFKLVDPKGKNVWWRNQRDYVFPRDWQRMTIRKSRLDYAWGTGPGGAPKQVGAIEFAISAGQGGSGSVWIGDLGFEAREPAGQDGVGPEAQASTSLPVTQVGERPAVKLEEIEHDEGHRHRSR